MRPSPGTAPYALLIAALLCAALKPASAAPEEEGASVAPEPSAGAQAAPAAEATAGAGAAEDGGVFLATLPTDISTASYYELVAWLRSLGLSDSGSVDELRSRLYEHYGVSAPNAAAKAKRTISIERAATARYFKAAEDEDGIVRASGGVVLTVTEEGGATHRVEADELAYDREHGSVTARGSVKYVRKTGTVTETFTGEALSASMDDWSGVFLDGKVRRAGEGAKEGDRGLAMSAETMVKRSGDVLILDKGVISSCDADDPHYAIRAGKVWLLGDKEIAIADALFSVGNVPVLWLPFLYYPGDELVFHPVFGSRTREGRFVQTTTYLIGQKPKSTETSSIMKLVDSGDGASGKTELKGLFLRRVSGEAPKDEGTLKVMLDAYTGLGAFAGLAGSFPKAGPLTKLDFSLGLGLSRSLFSLSDGYSPYVSAGDWESVWNRSDFLGLDLPLRFGIGLSGSFKEGPISGSFALPLLSDPYFYQDFNNRSENMDWFSFLKSSNDATTTISTTTSLAQSLSFSTSLSPKFLAPWISSIDVTKVGASMSWLSMTLPLSSYSGVSTLYYVDPSRQFFYPSLLRPIDLALSLKGKFLDTASGAGQGTGGANQAPAAAALDLRNPWSDEPTAQAGEDSAQAEPGAAESAAPSVAGEASGAGDFRLPQRAPSLAAATTASPWSASIDWNLTPTAYLEDSYRTKELTEPSDVDFSLLYSLFSYKVAAGVDAKANLAPAATTATLSFAYSDQDQYRPYLYDQSPYVDKAAALLLADYQYKAQKLTGSFSVSSKPFSSSWLWSATSLSYNLASTLYSYKYSSLDSDSQPIYKEDYFGWNDTSITTHSAGLTLAVRPWNLSQSLGLTMSLPPLAESYSAKLALDGGPVDLGLSSRMYRASSDENFSFDPMTATLSFASDPWPSFTDTFIYDIEDDNPVSNISTLAWGPLSASLTAKRAIAYKLLVDSGLPTGWEAEGSEAFQPTTFSLSLKEDLKSKPESRATWSVSANAALSQSLLRFSESSITFGLTTSLKVSKFVDLSFSLSSQNSSAWRYYPELFNTSADLSRWKRNLLTDIWDSLSVWDTSALEDGLFKLKSLSFKMSHDLHDWDLSVDLTMTPELKSELKKYVIEPTLTILLAWRDISEIKTKATYTEDDGFDY
jgi:lipopolysaccharide assembly outer membrane protein LptD (OstA)